MATNTYLSGAGISNSAEQRPSFALAGEMRAAVLAKLREVNSELWLLLSIFVIAGAMNFLLDSQRMLLALYSLPAAYSAYCYGRRHATLTAIASVALIGLLMHFNSAMFSRRTK